MEQLQEVLQAMIEKYSIAEEDIALINEALINLEAPEYEGAEQAGEGEFQDPYAGTEEEG